uniref:Uncharacterized protein n=1 Tax=Cannabis sativa TaxID=3483 RepID=A0A803PJM9_CANSA
MMDAASVIGNDESILPVRVVISILDGFHDLTGLLCKTSLNPNASEIKRVMRKYECFVFDLVLHDGAPNVGGAWAMEATVQNALVIDAVKLSTHLLAPKGTFVTKLFERVVVHKPNSSRSVSAEIFVLAFNYKAPAKINPRILDVRHLFQGAIEPQKKKVLHDLGRVAKKRHCHGYEDVDTTLRKVSTAAEFIWPETLLDILGSITSISFHDPTSLLINHHAVTTQEVKILCDDLGVLGKQDFKHLLKEMEELTHVLERKKKRVKKLHAKRQAKEKLRKEMAMQMDGVDDSYVDRELFSLSTIKVLILPHILMPMPYERSRTALGVGISGNNIIKVVCVMSTLMATTISSIAKVFTEGTQEWRPNLLIGNGRSLLWSCNPTTGQYHDLLEMPMTLNPSTTIDEDGYEFKTYRGDGCVVGAAVIELAVIVDEGEDHL